MKLLQRRARAFTLLEVMVAMAILGIALLGLLGLHHQSMVSVIRAQQTTRAAMLAQAVMTEAELERFPDLGMTSGDFQAAFPNEFPDFRWARNVVESGMFPDVRRSRFWFVTVPSFRKASSWSSSSIRRFRPIRRFRR